MLKSLKGEKWRVFPEAVGSLGVVRPGCLLLLLFYSADTRGCKEEGGLGLLADLVLLSA